MAAELRFQFSLALPPTSLDGQVSDTSSMSSDAASEDGLSSVSLEDSTYEIVSNHPDQTLDQADESDFTAPDDTRSIGETSTFSEPHVWNELHELNDSALQVNDADTPNVVDSQTSLLDQQDNLMTSGTIVSAEDGSESPFSFPSLPETPTHYFSVPLARYPLRLNRPLRIVYHGPETHRTEILDKIAQAVATSAKPEMQQRGAEDGFDKYQVIPVPSESGHDPLSSSSGVQSRIDVTLIPSSGLEIAVQICDVCNDQTMDHRRTSCRSNLSSGMGCSERGSGDGQAQHTRPYEKCSNTCHQGRFCTMHRLSENIRAKAKVVPDLAIYFHCAGHAAPNMSTCATSCSYMCSADTSGHGIPVLDIAEDRRFSNAEIPRFEPSQGVAAHCTELQPFSSDSLTRPLDLEGFFALNNISLNRNIALLTGLHDGLFGLNLPSLKDLSAGLANATSYTTVSRDGSRPNLVAAALALAIGLIGWTMIMSGYSSAQVNFVDRQFEPAPAITETVNAVWTHMQKGLVVAPTSAQPVPTETISPVVAWSVADADDKATASRLSRLLTSADDEYVVSLPDHLAALNRPPEMFASALQAGTPLEVQLVKINASAANIDLAPLRSLEPVEITVATRSRSARSFKTVILCLKRSSNAFAIQTRSIHSLATTLFGSLGERWILLALSEAERLFLVTKHWLEMTLHEVKGTTMNMRDSSARLLKDGKLLIKDRNPFTRKAVEARNSRSREAVCIQHRLANSKNKNALGAELYCKSRRLSAELSDTWNDHAKTYMNQLKSSQGHSVELYKTYKARLNAFGDDTLRTAHRRALKLTQDFKKKVGKARKRARTLKQRSKSYKAERNNRRRTSSSP